MGWFFWCSVLQHSRKLPPQLQVSLAPVRQSLLFPGTQTMVASRGFADYPDHTKVTLPALSPTMEFGTVTAWEKKEGDYVNEGDLLCEIETDKATMGFETPEPGYVAKVFVESGTKDIPIGKLLAIIVENEDEVAKFKDFEDDGSSLASTKPQAPKEEKKEAAATPTAAPASPPKAAFKPAAQPAPAAAKGGARPFASPAAKKMAAERGIDLGQIASGSGMDGMITTKDLEGVSPSAAAAAAVPGPTGAFLGALPPPQGEFSDAELTNMRRTIAKRLQQSKLEVPHYYLSVECAMDGVMRLRKEINDEYAGEDVKLSVNDFIIKATALASRRVPECNSAWMGDFIREYHTCDVSVAVDTGAGLITPIVAGAESKGLAQISSEVKELAARAKEGKLQLHEFQGGSITISNLGMFGIEHFTAIINQPQSCILAVGGTRQKVVPDPEGGTKVENVMKVTLSCDHRVVDGAVGAKWLSSFKKFLENPKTMLL